MYIEGTYTLQASPEEVWQCLTDKEVLRHALAGLEKLEERDRDAYDVSLHIKQAPLSGTYKGQVTITEQQYPYYCRFKITEDGEHNAISGEGTLHLNERNGNTVVAYRGKLAFGKFIPALVAKGAAKLLTQQFFISLAEQLRLARSKQPQYVTGQEPTTDDIIILTSHASIEDQEEPQPLSVKVVRLLRIGEGDPEEELLWATRIRRASIISALLVLVWLGTRIPRRVKDRG